MMSVESELFLSDPEAVNSNQAIATATRQQIPVRAERQIVRAGSMPRPVVQRFLGLCLPVPHHNVGEGRGEEAAIGIGAEGHLRDGAIVRRAVVEPPLVERVPNFEPLATSDGQVAAVVVEGKRPDRYLLPE